MLAPWNLYPAHNVETNGHIEVEYFNLLTPDVTIPLGPAPCNACPVEFRSADPLRGIPQGVPISLGPAPWNEIYPKKHLSPGIPVIPLWQNSCNLSYAIPLGFTPPALLNRVPSGCSTGWNLYPACNIDKNGHIEVESFNLLKPDLTIPLGFCYCSKKVFQKAPPVQC